MNDPIIYILFGLAALLLIIAGLGSYHHVHKAAFKPVFKRLSDGSRQMEFADFGGVQTTRTKRFYEQYHVGMEVPHEGKLYRITQIKEVSDPSLARTNIKMVAYLEEV